MKSRKLVVAVLIVVMLLTTMLLAAGCFSKKCTRHSYFFNRVGLEATCQNEGYDIYKCDNCDDEIQRTTSKLEHNYGEKTVFVQGDCTTDTIYKKNCKACGHEVQETVAASGHNYNGVTTKNPTCTEPGEMEYTCMKCKDSYKKSVDPTGHTPEPIREEIKPTCQSKGVSAGKRCKVCKVVIEESVELDIVDHSYDKGACIWCEERQVFEINFIIDGEIVATENFTIDTDSVTEPIIPEKIGYTVIGWEEYELGYENLMVNAVYEANKFNVNLDAVDGILDGDSVIEIAYESDYTLPVPQLDGMRFVGWFDGDGENATQYTDGNGNSISNFTNLEDVNLIAKYEVITYTIAFDTDGGTEIASKTYNHGDKLGELPIPTKQGMTFDGWYSEDGEVTYNAESIITADMTLYAHWINSQAISTAEQLKEITQNPSSNYFLTNDIDLRGAIWNPVDDYTGKFDGKNYTIKNFVLNTNAPGNNFGFFRVNNGIIKDVNFTDFTFNTTMTSGGNTHVAVIAGTNNGTIEGCNLISGAIAFNYSFALNRDKTFNVWVGELVGLNATGMVSNCSSNVNINVTLNCKITTYNIDITTNLYLGGLVGENNDRIFNSYYNGNITLDSQTISNGSWSELYNYLHCGGVVGKNNQGTCDESYANSSVTVTSNTYTGSSGRYGYNYGYIGMFAGYNCNKATISNSFTMGTIGGGGSSSNNLGGFIGFNDSESEINSCYSSAEISSEYGGNIGGLCGFNKAVIQNSYASSKVDAKKKSGNIGGFVGYNESSGTVTKCYATGNITTAGDKIGLFVGNAEGVMRKCYFLQTAYLLDNGEYVYDDGIIEYNKLEGKDLSVLCSEEFLADELYWDREGWIILVDENPLLQWEFDKSHVFNSIEVAPTCEYGGFTIYSCTDCSKMFVKDYVEPLGHTWENVTVTPPTCTRDGFTEQHCTREGCNGTRQTDIVEAIGHMGTNIKDDSNDATCVNSGWIIYYCDRVGCTAEVKVKYEAKGHNGSLVERTKDPTCTIEGEEIYHCEVCNVDYKVQVPKTEHHWIEVEYKSPSCGTQYDEEGNPIPGDEIIGNLAGVKCADCGEIKFGCEELNPHKMTIIETLEQASCLSDGRGIFKCDECNKEEERTIQATGHIDSDRDNICEICGEFAFGTNIPISQFTHISDASGLKNIMSNPYGSYYLDEDIDLTGIDWTPLGSQNNPFKGILYGNNKTITGLTFNATNKDGMSYFGLFSHNQGTIVNLKIANFSVTAVNSSVTFGAIAAVNNGGQIFNCEVVGENNLTLKVEKIITENKQVATLEYDFIIGGIVGENNDKGSGKIVACVISGDILTVHDNKCRIETKATSTIWQLLGQWFVQRIYETKVKTIQHISFGGIAGRNMNEIANCEVSGNITSKTSAIAELNQLRGEALAYTYMYAGALVGFNSGIVTDCSAKEMIYEIVEREKFLHFGNFEIPDIFTGKTYKYGYMICNYAQFANGISGVVGTNSPIGVVTGLTIL